MVEIDPNDFIPPPECPVFEPTLDEFQEPLIYISKIRPIAEKAGICKIKPPPEWQPPFAVDVDTFQFTPRIQRLNELEARTRIKLNFLDHLAKFWDLQGHQLRIPNVERRSLDLFMLAKVVAEEGYFEVCCREKKWAKIASRMGYPAGRGTGATLRMHYERIIHPFDLFQAGATIDPEKLKKLNESSSSLGNEKLSVFEQKYKPHGIADKEAEGNYHRRLSKRIIKDENKIDYSANSELKKLQFFGAGPKAAVPSDEEKEEEENKDDKMKTRDRKPMNYVDQYHCVSCKRGDQEQQMLLCDGCDDAFHTFCLIPPLPDIPKGDWRCPKCIVKICSKKSEAYGFAQAKKSYTLQQYGEMADQFKLDFFNMPVHMVPCSTVEKEFWRLVNCVERDVCVEYGADIHAADCGSGFPTVKTKDLLPEDEEYIKSGWNLNNLPTLEQSVLKYIHADISGMKIPWCYVGMCFSSFCWHNEDHWSYSINYLHWGEPKTWYGVPGAKAELLEECMKKNAPELFEQSPDLLHQLTTIMHPNILMAYGVPIVRTNQCAGEFIVTFPRSYHAGFNQGYNFAEAVNFCPPDWLPIGRACIEHYRALNRQCVFSHEELICKMAANQDTLNLSLAAATHQDMLALIAEEKDQRKSLIPLGVTQAKRQAFELLADDERQCATCKTTCFLSAISCSCNPSKIVCIGHVKNLCSCATSSYCLHYRYTLDELPAMLRRLKSRVEDYDNWAFKVKEILEAKSKLCLGEFEEYLSVAREKKFPDSWLLHSLEAAVDNAQKCADVANQLVAVKQVKTRHAHETRLVVKLTLDELESFVEQVEALPCVIDHAEDISSLLRHVKAVQLRSSHVLSQDLPAIKELEELVSDWLDLDIDMPDLVNLEQRLALCRWLKEVDAEISASNCKLAVADLKHFLESGLRLMPHSAADQRISQLQKYLNLCETLEEKANSCLQSQPRQPLSVFEEISQESKELPMKLPLIKTIEDNIIKAKEWTMKVQLLQSGEHYPYLGQLETMYCKAKTIHVLLEQLSSIESQINAAKAWRDRTFRTFARKNSVHSLLEILSPRYDIGICNVKMRRRKHKESLDSSDSSKLGGGIVFDENRDPAAVVALFKAAEARETNEMMAVREKNGQKSGDESEYCICRKESLGFMLQCELCRDWFHANCVPLPCYGPSNKNRTDESLMEMTRDMKYLCPLCVRSRRPRLERILSLLVSLQKLPVRLPEGDALQCLTERAMAWQDSARGTLSTEELSVAAAKINKITQDRMSPPSVPPLPLSLCQAPASPNDSEGTLSDNEENAARMESEHAYSSSTPTATHQSTSSVDTLTDNPTICLSEESRTKLERLMMQGDLLEVSLEETQQIWRILQACQAPPNRLKQMKDWNCSMDNTNDNTNDSSEKQSKQKKRKTKDEELKIPEQKKKIKTDIVKEKKKKKIKKEGDKKKDSDGVEDDVCSAEKCDKPTGNHVNWVQCDKCEEWFHMICVGVTKDQVANEDEYNCKNCLNC